MVPSRRDFVLAVSSAIGVFLAGCARDTDRRTSTHTATPTLTTTATPNEPTDSPTPEPEPTVDNTVRIEPFAKDMELFADRKEWLLPIRGEDLPEAEAEILVTAIEKEGYEEEFPESDPLQSFVERTKERIDDQIDQYRAENDERYPQYIDSCYAIYDDEYYALYVTRQDVVVSPG